MHDEPTIRVSNPADIPAIRHLYPRAFPDEDLVALVERLLTEREVVLSLVAEQGRHLVGHVAFTLCAVEGSAGRVALLGPLAVAPEAQRRGIGRALIAAGLARLGESDVAQVNLLGDPGYYGRFGFRPDVRVLPPYTLPEEWQAAWQSLVLTSRAKAIAGTLQVPDPWRDPALWLP